MNDDPLRRSACAVVAGYSFRANSQHIEIKPTMANPLKKQTPLIGILPDSFICQLDVFLLNVIPNIVSPRFQGTQARGTASTERVQDDIPYEGIELN